MTKPKGELAEQSDDEPVEPVDPDAPRDIVGDDGEALRFLPDGRILAAFDRKNHTLRRPRFGEYRRLRDRMLEVETLGARVGKENLERQRNGEPYADEQELYDLTEKFVREAFDTLSDRKLPDSVDDFPTWLLVGTPFSQWVQHWRIAPLAPGDQGQEA